ncbi:hypothetical protein [Lapillicoccus jejuensis]|uniref:Htaa protein n=1 Tax=Lapillicoccus jejuensis TaxID=402171 RepID=A0A542DY46_9MICO|nr:hypothetical protein [Lapillicoccus jejuensis]TQJ08007.1 hypothetical protein FB458_1084 [Lapillicoccus jejuensis]
MSLKRPRRAPLAALFVALLAVVGLAAAPSAGAATVSSAPAATAAKTLGTTTVTTAPGVAEALLRSGIVPLPAPGTTFGVKYRNGVLVSYGFPITGSTADLAAGTGDITHSGGIVFVGKGRSLAVGSFDIDLAAGKVFATTVNGAAAHVPLLDLDLAKVRVGTVGTTTVVSGVGLKLDPVAAGVLNRTFGSKLPTDGSLTFGTANVRIRG